MRFFIALSVLLSFVSCSFKSQTGGGDGAEGGISISSSRIDESMSPDLDSDGDMVTNLEEMKLGRNPFVSDLPELKVRFLQNFKIQVNYFDTKGAPPEKEITIDTKIGAMDSDFQYRVGKIFLRENAYQSAATIGKFSGHTSGKILDRDYSWVKYPDIDPRFFHEQAIKVRLALNEFTRDITAKTTLENTVQLQPNKNFDSIKNLEISFYYYNYEKESYELLSTQKIEKNFFAGVTETFEVTLENLPLNLLMDNFLKKGEFIISEVTDYEIPSLKTTYSQLMKSVKNKTIPVAFNTPLESKISFVSVKDGGSRFSEIMETLFDRNFKIEGDNLIKVGQFENNLPSFTYLREVQDKDKLGKWFVFTNDLTKNFLDHEFVNGDTISLSYITGSELSLQSAEKVYVFSPYVRSGNIPMGEDDTTIVPLGNVTPNSRIDVQIKPFDASGNILSRSQEIIDTQDSSCGRNCFSFGKYCRWDITTPKIYGGPFTFNKDLSGRAEQMTLLLNNVEYPLKDLLKDQKIMTFWKGGNLHISIPDITKIQEIKNFEDNVLALKLTEISETDFWGIKLVAVGRTWDGVGGCPFITPGMALDKDLPISNESVVLDRIKWFHQNAIRPDLRARIRYSDKYTARQWITVNVSSVINNFHN